MCHTGYMKHTVEFETNIACSVQTLFAFHADTQNLPRITPPGTSVEILQLDEILKQGNIAKLKIKKGLFSFVWELVFETVDSPRLIVDVATRSPFKSFIHEHHFIEVNAGHSILRDKITFSLPFEPLSNVALWFIKRDIQKMFVFRHRQTKKLIDKKVL